jgi:hypothetical protein
MSTNDCRNARGEIDQSELGQRLSESAESHLITCASCAAFRAERTRLRELVGSLQPVTAPADFDLRLRARIARERGPRATSSFFRVFMSTPAIAVAALIVMIVGGIVWLKQHNAQPPVPAIAANPPVQNPLGPVAAGKDQPPANAEVNPAPESDRGTNSTIENQKLASVPGRNGQRSAANPNASSANDFSVSGARSYQLNPDRAGEVSLSAPGKPMVVTVYDEKGGSRKILLPAISFGAQRLTDKTTPVSMTNTRDW